MSRAELSSLTLGTGEEERFAFKRAVSRVHEMSSPEYLVTANHTPLDPSFRTWERPSSEGLPTVPARANTPAKHSMGPAVELTDSEEKLSGVLDPRNLRVRHPEGLPATEKQVEVKREKAKRGIRYNVLDETIDVRRDVPPPVLKNDHVWG